MEYEVKVDAQGKFWYKKGTDVLHREDGPAIEYANGDKGWYRNGKRHREGGPAVEYANGDKFWYKDGELHREDGPAVEEVNGDKYWYRHGKLCRSQCVNPDDETPDAVKVALDHVREFHPEVVMVAFSANGEWRYFDENFGSPAFGNEINLDLLEDALESVETFPAIFQIDMQD